MLCVRPTSERASRDWADNKENADEEISSARHDEAHARVMRLVREVIMRSVAFIRQRAAARRSAPWRQTARRETRKTRTQQTRAAPSSAVWLSVSESACRSV